MKNMHRLGLPSLLLTTVLLSPLTHADDGTDPSGAGENTKNISEYLKNLGSFLGFDLTKTPPELASPLLASTSFLLSAAGQTTYLQNTLNTFIGAIPINSAFNTFIPNSSSSAYKAFNTYANAVFPSYTDTNATTGVSVNPLIDQPPFEADPVSQGILNILATPNYSYCMNTDATQWIGAPVGSPGNGTVFPKCSLLYDTQVMNNVLGELPMGGNPDFYTPTYNQNFLSQLNSNTLLAPLVYSTTADTSSNQSPGGTQAPSTDTGKGLIATTQAEQAANFIRYVTSAVSPVSLPQYKDYSALLVTATTAVDPNKSADVQAQIQAQATLANYFTKLRVYAAQTSVAYSNLYYMLSKRMPQNTGGTDGSQTSEALNEYTMATWRLYNPSGTSNPQWLNGINSGSTATVQKEMAQLLAEINYQLYLTRQQQERLLITNTMLLLLSARSSLPPTTNLSASINNPN